MEAVVFIEADMFDCAHLFDYACEEGLNSGGGDDFWLVGFCGFDEEGRERWWFEGKMDRVFEVGSRRCCGGDIGGCGDLRRW